MTRLTIEIDDEKLNALQDYVSRGIFESVDKAVAFALLLLDDGIEEDAELVRLVAESEDDQTPVLWDVESFLREQHERADDRKAA